MADIINLRRARKEKARNDKAEQAEKNRQHFGRSKTEKQNDGARKDRNDWSNHQNIRQLNHAKLDKDD